MHVTPVAASLMDTNPRYFCRKLGCGRGGGRVTSGVLTQTWVVLIVVVQHTPRQRGALQSTHYHATFEFLRSVSQSTRRINSEKFSSRQWSVAREEAQSSL